MRMDTTGNFKKFLSRYGLSHDEIKRILAMITIGSNISGAQLGRPIIGSLPPIEAAMYERMQKKRLTYCVSNHIYMPNQGIGFRKSEIVDGENQKLLLTTFEEYLDDLATQESNINFFESILGLLSFKEEIPSREVLSPYEYIEEAKEFLLEALKQIHVYYTNTTGDASEIVFLNTHTALLSTSMNKNILVALFRFLKNYNAPESIFALFAFVLSPFRGWYPFNIKTSLCYAGLPVLKPLD